MEADGHRPQESFIAKLARLRERRYPSKRKQEERKDIAKQREHTKRQQQPDK